MEVSISLFTYEGAAARDRAAIASGLSALQLMGTAAAQTAGRLLELRKNHVHIVCGKGNNGGDGWALAWMLLGAGAGNLTLYAEEEPRSEEARKYASLVQPHLQVQKFADLRASRDDAIVEALLGSGQKGAPSGSARTALDRIALLQDQGTFVLSLDVPAGLIEEAPADWSAFPLPDAVHSYGAGKLACALDPAQSGRVQILPIGFHPAPPHHEVFLIEPAAAPVEILRKRATDHKYSAGSALIIAGEEGMEGAALLSARSFFAAGGGIAEVRTFSEGARRTLLAADPSLMTGIAGGAPGGRAVLAGPGIRLNEDKAGLILQTLAQCKENTPVILDASCAALPEDSRYPAFLKRSTLLTPHHGEWKRLGGTVPDCVQGFEAAVSRVRALGVQVLVKGPVSVLVNSSTCLVMPAPEAGLATAGSGDCLAGILLAALARGLDLNTAVPVALGLLHRAARRRFHPEASELPDLLRRELSGIA